MATAKLMKNVKSSPPSSSSSSPSSFKNHDDAEELYTTTSLKSDDDDDDLVDVMHSILMLIVEGRMTAKSKHGITTKEGAHAIQLIDKLNAKLMHLTTNEQQQYGSGKHFKPENTCSMLHSSMKMATKNGAALNTEHVCSTRHFIQCQIASKLKHKLIEKCMLEHQSLLKKRNHYNQYQPERSQIQHCQIQEKLFLAKYQLLKPNHYNNNPSASLTQTLPAPSSTQFSSLVSSETVNSYLELDKTCLNSLPCIINTNTLIQIDVILLDNCCFADIISKFGDNIILVNDDNENLEKFYTYDLLERWNISMISTSNLKNNDNTTATSTTIAKSLLSINELFQAIRSYLHFSQISSWINQTKGEQPKNIAFTFKYTTESKEVVDAHKEFVIDANESAYTSLQEASNDTSFDNQTFPTLSLLFANKKFYLSKNYSSNLTNQSKQLASSTILKINLQSKKRSTLAAAATAITTTTESSASSTSSLSSINAINSGLIVLAGIPQIICNKLHSNNTFSLGKNSPPSHHLPIIVSNFYKHLNTMSNNHQSNNEANVNFNLVAINSNLNSYYSNQNELLLTPTSLLNTYKSSSTLALTPPTTPTPQTGNIHFKPFESLRHASLPRETLSEECAEFDNNLDTSQSPKVLVSNILTTISNMSDSMSTNLCIACNNINEENGLIEDGSNQEESQLKQIESSTMANSFAASSTCKLITSPIDNVRISLFKKCIKESEKEADISLQREVNIDDKELVDNLSDEYPCESDASGLKTPINQCKYVNYNYSSSLSKNRRNSNGNMNNNSIYINNMNKLATTTTASTNFPLSSSPAPMRKSGALQFDFDQSLKNPRSIKNALSVNLITKHPVDEESTDNNNNSNIETNNELVESTSIKERSNEIKKYLNNLNKSIKMQLSFSNRNISLERQSSCLSGCLTPNCLLGSFEESLLNGRMNPVGVVDGFYAEIGASGSFFPEHVILPVYAAFYQVCEDIAASPYLGVINLASLANNGSSGGSKRGYRVPNKGTIQVTLFNPNKTVVKMFVVMYDLSDMPPNHRTFIRQRTMYVPLHQPTSATSHADETTSSTSIAASSQTLMSKSFLRYLIHLRFATSKSGKMYLHTNIKLIFARNKSEIDPRLGRYEYKTFTESPKNPRYSLKK